MTDNNELMEQVVCPLCGIAIAVVVLVAGAEIAITMEIVATITSQP